MGEDASRERAFIGYRGTSKQRVQDFLNSGQWEVSTRPDEYLGHGTYFFENDYQEAYKWAKYNRKLDDEEIEVIKVNIKVKEKEVFDLLDSTTCDDYLKIVKKIGAKFYEADNIPDHPADCKLINLICDRDGYKLVRGAFSPNKKLAKELISANLTRMRKIHIQLCVKDPRIIEYFEICS